MEQLRIELRAKNHNAKFSSLCVEQNLNTAMAIEKIEHFSFYKIEGEQLSSEKFQQDCREIFCDPIIQDIYFDDSNAAINAASNGDYIVEVCYRAGVTDNPALSAKDALSLLNWDVKICSGEVTILSGDLDRSQVTSFANEMLGNALIQEVKIFSAEAFHKSRRFEQITVPKVLLGEAITTAEIPLNLADEELIKLSQERCLALTLEEMKFIGASFEKTFARDEKRQRLGLPAYPSELELEVIAQSWSEHCKHKIFSADINFTSTQDGKKQQQIIHGLYPTFIKKSTREIKEKRNLDWLVSVFSDNAGIVRFDDFIDLCIKVETHNSPSALDPYGGALTGILGVNRDILGCGMGAKPIANTDVFCLGPIDETLAQHPAKNPLGLKHPRQILRGVHKGIEDGGNKSGIPTINGAIFHDLDYAGKPLIFCGTVGTLPQEVQKYAPASGAKVTVPSAQKLCLPGDLVVMIGGAIGADGIHGATFSSLELDENSPSTAVQIGDPLTQKRMTDFLLEARDLGLYTCITDNGAGGLSSSIGEMATITNGARIDLALCPVKYPGLKPYELMISESQERMTLAVSPATWREFSELAQARGVLATALGEFNDSGFLTINYGQQTVGYLDLIWLHESLPKMQLTAQWHAPTERREWYPMAQKKPLEMQQKNQTIEWQQILCTLLSRPNIASKEKWVRQYDHEVQGATHIKPFVGPEGLAPSDSGVIWLAPHGGEQDNGVGVGCGLAPRLSLYDPYLMAQFAVDEALRNVLASGGDIQHCCLLDNFCWPDPVLTEKNPDGDYKLGQLVRTCQGLYDICHAYGTPLVSGKDSMKNDFKGKNRDGEEIKISVLPTLLVTAMAKTRISESVSSPFKAQGDVVYLLGAPGDGLLGSELLETYQLNNTFAERLPSIDLENNYRLYKKMKSAFSKKIFRSVHDISDGGLLCAVAESAMGGNLGVSLNFPAPQANDEIINHLFNEAPGRFIVSVQKQDAMDFESLFASLPFSKIGVVVKEKKLNIQWGKEQLMNIDVDQLKTYWREHHE